MKEQIDTPHQEEPRDFPRTGRILSVLFAAFLAVQLVTTYVVDTSRWRMWGVDFPSFLSGDPLMLLLALLPVPFLFPSVMRRFAGPVGTPGKKRTRRAGWRALAVAAGTMTVVTIAIWLLPVAYPFLGDGAAYVTDLYRVIHFPAHESLLVKTTSVFTGYLIVALIKNFQISDLTLPYLIVGHAAAFVLVLLLAFMRRNDSRVVLWLAVALFGLTAGSMMFFGYVELYALQYVFTIGFFLTGWRSFRGRNGVWLPTLLFVLAAMSGLSSIIYLPAWVFLVMRAGKKPAPAVEKRIVLGLLGVMALTLIVAYAVVGAGGSSYLIPLVPVDKVLDGIEFGSVRYTMFSPAHLADMLNALALHAVTPVLLIAALLAAGRARIEWTSQPLLFATVAVCAGVLALLSGESNFGLARDWDLASIFVLPVTFLAFVLAMQLLEARTLALLLSLLLAFQCSLFGRWILVNHDGPASGERLSALVEGNAGLVLPPNTYNGLENLRKFYGRTRNTEAQFRTLKSMWATGHESMNTLTHLLGVVQGMKEPEKRPAEFAKLIALAKDRLKRQVPPGRYDHVDPSLLNDFLTRTLLAAAKYGHRDFADRSLVELGRALPQWKGAPFYKAVLDTVLPPAEAVRLAENSVGPTSKDVPLLDLMGRLYWMAERYDDAALVYRRALALDGTGYPGIYLTLARLYDQKLEKRDSTVIWLRSCIEKCETSAEAKQAKDILVNQLGLSLPN